MVGWNICAITFGQGCTCTILPQVPPLHLSLPTIWNFSSHSGHISRWTPLQDKDQIRVSRHKCYLVPFLAILCLCEDMVSAKEKKVADVLMELPAQRYSISRRKKIFSQSIASWLYVLMPYGTIFGTRRSCLFFKLFHYTLWFLTEPVMWPVSPAYQEPREMTQDMKVVNGKYMPKWNMTLAIRWCHTDRNWPLLPPLMPPQDRLERH